MRRSTVTLALLCLAGCGRDNRVDSAKQQETTELAACRTTYPVGTGAFAALVRCEMGAAADYVERIDPSENEHQERIARELESLAGEVDSGHMTMQDWQARASDAVHSLRDAKRTAEATSAVL